MSSPKQDFERLIKFLVVYQSRKAISFGRMVESFKNATVEILMLRRGKFQKHVWHSSMIGLVLVGLLTSGIIGGSSIVASTLPGIGAEDPRDIQTFDPLASGSSQNFFVNLKTSISQKPRDKVENYTVKSGDTLSGIADSMGISVDTIKWANNLDSDTVKPGQVLKILPVSGVAITVKSGDTLESIAKKYQADAQAILDFPFNDVPDDFKLSPDQTLIVPDGQPPEVKTQPRLKAPPVLAQGSTSTYSAPGGGNFIWPTRSLGISQYFAWYHPGVDLPNPAEPPVVAADGGVVLVAGWPDNYGYGNRVVIDHGNGYETLYAHLSNIFVGIGERVSRGQTIGQMGSTGRSTGPHLHFEIHYKGIALNPLAILK